MRPLRALLWRLAGLLGRRRSEADLSAELESHLAMHAEENQLRGMAPDEARRRALIDAGGLEQAREMCRDRQSLPWVENLLQDTRYGLRALRKNPGFTAVAVITLALGIGANTAIFSIVNAVLLQPLNYEDPARLTTVFNSSAANKRFGASPPDFRALRDRNHSLSGLSAFFNAVFNLTGTDRPQRVLGAVVSAEYFTTFGVRPMLGRTFSPGEEKWGSHHVMVVSEGFWRSHLNADRNLSGKTLNLDGETYQVIGVMPASFYTGPADLVLWLPMAWKPRDNYDTHNNFFLTMVGRLKPGVTQAQAFADLNSVMQGIAQEFPENKGIGVGLQPLHEDLVGAARPPLLILLCTTGGVLLIACVNLANLLLARSAGRQKEISVRSALGASRGRLLQQFFTESVLLSGAGGLLGLGLAYLCLDLLPFAGDVLPRTRPIHVDGWVLLFTAVVSLVTGVVFGLLPALESSRGNKLSESLKEGGRAAAGSARSNRFRGGLVISEVALALVLLIGSGLAIRSLQRLLHVDAGFVPEHVLTFDINLPDFYDPQPDPLRTGAATRVAAFYRDALARIEEFPGVKAAGAISSLPLQGENWVKFFTPLDRPLPASIDHVDSVQYRSVLGHYFSALGIRLVRGRLLDEHDQATTSLSVLVNETLVRKYWPDQDPIGKTVLLTPPESLIPPQLIPPGYQGPRFTVVGVVGDAHYGALDQDPAPVVYASVLQHDATTNPSFAVRTDGDPNTLIASVRAAVMQLDKDVPVANIHTMEELVSTSVAQPRLEAVLLGIFGGLAMLLAAVGIYGVMSYYVSQRTSEIGLRMALGANHASVLALICKQGLRWAGLGLACGLVLAVAVTRLMSKILFGISPTDPLTFAAIVILLTAVALLACYVPARRATKVDPIVALRYE